MPFKSKAQLRKFFAMEARGQLPKGTAERWANETPSIKKLPNKVKSKKPNKKEMAENKFVGKYLESQMITGAQESDQKTPLGATIMEIITANNRNQLIPTATLEAIITNDPIDATEFRNKRIQLICTKLMDVLVECDLHVSEWEAVSQTILGSIQMSYYKAEEILWKTPEKSLLDIDRILKNAKVTVNDVLKRPVDR